MVALVRITFTLTAIHAATGLIPAGVRQQRTRVRPSMTMQSGQGYGGPYSTPPAVRIYDTTLRDGTQG